MKLTTIQTLAFCLLLMASLASHAGALGMGETTVGNGLAPSDCACRAKATVATPSAQAESASAEVAPASICTAKPGTDAETGCTGSGIKADPTTPGAAHKLHNGIRWQSLLPGVMK